MNDLDDLDDRAPGRSGRRSRWARRGAWALAVLLVPTALAVPLANAFDPTAEKVPASAPLAPVGLQAPTNLRSPDAADLNAKVAAEAAEDYEDAALRHPTAQEGRSSSPPAGSRPLPNQSSWTRTARPPP